MAKDKNDGGKISEDAQTESGGLVILFHLFEDPQYFSGGLLLVIALVIHHVINLLIIVSTVALCMETYPEYNPDVPGNEGWRDTWRYIEITCVLCFSVDFIMRLLGSIFVGTFKQFRTDPMNWVDILAILPFYLERMIGGMLDLRFVRVIRLARILRALRSARFGNMGTIITDIIRNSAAALAIPIYFMMLALVLFSSLVYYAEEATEMYGCYPPGADAPLSTDEAKSTSVTDLVRHCDACPCWTNTTANAVQVSCGTRDSPGKSLGQGCHIAHWTLYNGDEESIESGVMFQSIPDTFWWCIVTFTTVGYGDKYPRTAVGRILGSLTMFMGIFFIAMPLTIVGSSFSNSWEKIKSQQEADYAEEGKRLLEGDDRPLSGLKSDVDAHFGRLKELVQDCQGVAPGKWSDVSKTIGELDTALNTAFSS